MTTEGEFAKMERIEGGKEEDVGRKKDEESLREEEAAMKIQQAWRKTPQVGRLNADVRWSDAALAARLETIRTEANEGKNDAHARWERGVVLAGRLEDKGRLPDESIAGMDASNKILEVQHWLELTDSKHRYGSNLKYYHRRWLDEDTTDNFFKWLNRGAGKDLSLPECPREKLEKERIVYLSPEQRLNYLVKIDTKGLLRWVRNDEFVDTTSGKWQDAGDGGGIVPYDGKKPLPPLRHRTSFESFSSASSSGSGSGSGHAHHPGANALESSPGGQEANKSKISVNHESEPAQESNPFKEFIKERMPERFTKKKSTWIYVSDNHFNIFIGIKNTGTFQHSSFLSGGRVTSAGLISVHDGLIHRLSPLSGHYRTSVSNFRQFISALEKRGVDMHKVNVKEAEAELWGVLHMNTFKKTKGKMFREKKKEVKEEIEKVMGMFTGSRSKEDEGAKKPTQGTGLPVDPNSPKDSKKSREEIDDEDDDSAWITSHWRQDILMGRGKIDKLFKIPEDGEKEIVQPSNAQKAA